MTNTGRKHYGALPHDQALHVPVVLLKIQHMILSTSKILSDAMPRLLEKRQNCSSGEQWFVCSSNAFRGCCAQDPCSLIDGCPNRYDSSAPSQVSATDDGDGRSSAYPTSSSSSDIRSHNPLTAVQTIASVSGGQTVFITITRDASPTSTGQAEGVASPVVDHAIGGGSPVGAIAGGTVGGVAAVAGVVFVLFFLRRKQNAKETRRATLPPSYEQTDMSEHLGGTTTASAGAVGVSKTTDEKAGLRDIERDAEAEDTVPQLDSTMIMPTAEIGVDPLGSIPELPASERNPFETPRMSAAPPADSTETQSGDSVESNDHVMSWAQFNSFGNRNPSSRLLMPHPAPDTTGAVWENLTSSPIKTRNRGDEEAGANEKG
ncbi:hypothetical protein P154DRAFT_523362 [Amniculicola lignicola CBS 123094]|uniref:Uncharacterized protein n=1 Tax=Amniculicola lignicola CBS 123094 TaxID=1392246 RepID=A0A6A5WBT0_9PLEO|nr:hypothetical protein P154DRAFT_523362 [Amniculicola lignicola CBS 123094]